MWVIKMNEQTQRKWMIIAMASLLVLFTLGVFLQQRSSNQPPQDEPKVIDIQRPILDDFKYTMLDTSLPSVQFDYEDPFNYLSNQVFLIKSIDELIVATPSLTTWEAGLRVPVFKKIELSFEQMQQRAMDYQSYFEVESAECEWVNKDDSNDLMISSNYVSCVSDEVFVQVYQDKTTHIRFMNEESYLWVQKEQPLIQGIEEVLFESTIMNLFNFEDPVVVISKIEYDIFDEKVESYQLMNRLEETTLDDLLSQSIELTYSSFDQAVVGFTIPGDYGDIMGMYPLLQMEEVIEKLKKGLFYSTLITVEDLQFIEVLKMELTIDTSIHQSMFVPVVTFYYTTPLQKFQACATGEGLKMGTLKVSAIDEYYIRINRGE